MKENNKEPIKHVIVPQEGIEEVNDRYELSQLLIFRTEVKREQVIEAQRRFETETRQMISGETFTIAGIQEDYRRYIADIEKRYEPKFSLFLKRLGILCNWTEEEKKKFRKPHIAALTIIQVIYLRFPDGLMKYLKEHNKYVGYFIRRTKNYMLLNEQGILKLEEYIDNANQLMPKCTSYYDFRKKMFEEFEIPYQTELFEHLV